VTMREFEGVDPAAACIDLYGPVARRMFRVPADPPPKPPAMCPTGSPIVVHCRYMLADPLSLLTARAREPMTEQGKPRSHAAFEGWVSMHINHHRYCAHCREKVWLPL